MKENRISLQAIENFEQFWGKCITGKEIRYIPLNNIRMKFGYPATTPEEILQKVKQKRGEENIIHFPKL